LHKQDKTFRKHNPKPSHIKVGTLAGQLTSNPRQATADTLNILARKSNLESREGKAVADTNAALSDVQANAAAEKVQQASDYNNLLQEHTKKFEDAHNQTQQAYDEYRAKAGSLKDPGSQFWEDKGQGSRITSALAAFSSGLGAGLTGHGGNPFLDFLNKQIDNNFNAHKQNIEDLYNSQVAAGKIEDSIENHNRFMNEAKLKSYELQSAHIKYDLDSIASRGTSQMAKILADKAKAGLDQEGVMARQNLAAMEAKNGAAGLALQRQRQKEIQEAYSKFVTLHNADMGEDEARLAAVKDLVGMGYNRSELAPITSGVGVAVDPKTGDFILPRGDQGQESSSEPILDPKSNRFVAPSKSATGKLIKPEQMKEVQKDLDERTANVNGKAALFRTKEDAEIQKVVPEADRLMQVMQQSWQNGDKGAYDAARSQFIEMAPKLLGYKRGPSVTQAGSEERARQDDEDKSTIGGQLPELNPVLWSQNLTAIRNQHPLSVNSGPGIALHKLAGVQQTLDGIKKQTLDNLVSSAAPEKQSAEDIAKAKGWKKL
jgi:hypothetical protein